MDVQCQNCGGTGAHKRIIKLQDKISVMAGITVR